ncbi:MAG: hypothetical protein IPH18_09835 [Chitinophagaceae bacterium]|nr:hypothetical protein [Chitinophagaceae bacterium]
MFSKIKRLFKKAIFLNRLAANSIDRVKSDEDIKIENNYLFHGNNHAKNYSIGKYSYVSYNSIIQHCEIGNYCSIGPNVVIGFMITHTAY